VPDADDTAGALLALYHLQAASGGANGRLSEAIDHGVAWLLGVQNRDGGIPTFCRGWGTLPFDRSTPEITAHALRSWTMWWKALSQPKQFQAAKAVRRGLGFLSRSQRPDGSWVPLWFGNERAPGQENPTYGTAQVLAALDEIRPAGFSLSADEEQAGRHWLLRAQHSTGGWGGAEGLEPTVEETALALAALAGGTGFEEAINRGTRWLLETLAGGRPAAAPIGLYFAQLWYYERLYPLIWSVDALGRLRRSLDAQADV
jgi:squalene-hopene/tetraprenyl-beta-curcumene cyclase